MDRNVCAFDQPDVKERIFVSFSFWGWITFDSAGPVFDLYITIASMKEMKENQRRQTHHVSSVPSFCSRATCSWASKQERNWTKAFPHISFFYDFLFSQVQPDLLLSTKSCSSRRWFLVQSICNLGRTVGSVRRSRRDPTSKAFYLYSSSFSKKQVYHLVLYHVS